MQQMWEKLHNTNSTSLQRSKERLRNEAREQKRVNKIELGQKTVFISATIGLYKLILKLIFDYFRRKHRTKVECPQREIAESTAVCKVK